jgi:hypothetical protein
LLGYVAMMLASSGGVTLPMAGLHQGAGGQQDMDVSAIGKGGKGGKKGGNGKKKKGPCYNCGKEGQLAADCWYPKKNNVGQVDQPPEAGTSKPSEAGGGITMVSGTGPQEAWLFAVIVSAEPLGEDRLVIDSGTCVHVCPRGFAADWPLKEEASSLELYSATGKRLQIYGRRYVGFFVQDTEGKQVVVNVGFVVANVRRPLLSTASLSDQGFSVTIGPPEHHQQGW